MTLWLTISEREHGQILCTEDPGCMEFRRHNNKFKYNKHQKSIHRMYVAFPFTLLSFPTDLIHIFNMIWVSMKFNPFVNMDFCLQFRIIKNPKEFKKIWSACGERRNAENGSYTQPNVPTNSHSLWSKAVHRRLQIAVCAKITNFTHIIQV